MSEPTVSNMPHTIRNGQYVDNTYEKLLKAQGISHKCNDCGKIYNTLYTSTRLCPVCVSKGMSD